MSNRKLLISAALAISAAISPLANAIDLDAGDYETAPAGTTLGLLYLQDGQKNSLYSGSTKVAGHNGLNTDIGIARLVHYTDIGGILTLPQILLPFGHIAGVNDTSGLGTASGVGDIILAIPTWLINDTKNHTFFSIAPYLFVPTGNYSNHDPLSLGENRFKGTLQVAFSTRITPQVAWDIAADATVYGNNTDAVGGGTLKQNIGYQVQTNARYLISPKVDLRAGISYSDAGSTKQNGVTADSFTESKFWVGTGLWASDKTHIIFTYGKDIAVENGFKDNNQINLRLLQVF